MSATPGKFELEDGSGAIQLEDGASYMLQENALGLWVVQADGSTTWVVIANG
jgi:hypothetical protein